MLKFNNKLSIWHKKLLPYPERATLISSVVTIILLYTMSSLKLPFGITHKYTQHTNSFGTALQLERKPELLLVTLFASPNGKDVLDSNIYNC